MPPPKLILLSQMTAKVCSPPPQLRLPLTLAPPVLRCRGVSPRPLPVTPSILCVAMRRSNKLLLDVDEPSDVGLLLFCSCTWATQLAAS